METKILHMDEIDEIAAMLLEGKVIAFPTDTVFGLGVRYDSETAIASIKEAKTRPDSKPLPVMVSNKNQIKMVAEVDRRAEIIIEKWMPGALTIVLKKLESVPSFVTNGEPTVAIRMADDEFVQSMIDRVGMPLLVTSANISGANAAITDAEVIEQLDGRIDGIVVGSSRGGRASTIVDLTKNQLEVLREGPITLDRIVFSIKEEMDRENSIGE